MPAASARGIPVFNAPFSNTRSVAELTVGEIVMLLRRIPSRSHDCHNGGWDKSATNSFEVRGKTLGIVGYGNIGSQLSYLAEAMGMRVIFFDITDRLRHGNTEPTNALDAPSRARLLDVLAALPQAMVVVSHDAGVNERLATRAARLTGGRLEPVAE